jgi:phosphatidylglycerophosphatase C
VRRVAAFDFDGTLTQRDTLLPFLREAAGTVTVALAAVVTSPRLLAAALDDDRRNAAKAAFLRRTLKGREERALRELGARLVDNVLADGMRAENVDRLRKHLEDGDEVVIVSASPALYVELFGERLGAKAVLATRLEVGADGRLTGEIVGENVRRAEKVRRLEEWLAGDAVELWAYGDSKGDTELLARADHPTRV